MNVRALLPSGGITDDKGANLSSFENYKNLFAVSGIQDEDVPEGWSNKLKQALVDKPYLYKQCNPTSKKLTVAQKAFPLEDGESFWARMMKNESVETKSKIESTVNQQNSYISFGVNESSKNQTEVN